MIKNIFKYFKKYRIISIKDLIQKTGLSKGEIAENIDYLRSLGYDIIENENEKYSLIQENEDNFNHIEIEFYLETVFIGRKLKFFDEINSTNSFAKKFAEENENIQGVSIVARNQTNGKGRFGRVWVSQKDTNISLSLILTPDVSIFEVAKINLIIPIAICNAIKKYIGLDTNIKYPNDIIINGKKVAGILTEIASEDSFVKYIVVGIGINVNNDILPEELQEKATSLKLETGKTINRSFLLAKILLEIEKIYFEYEKSFCFECFINEYRALCLNIGREVQVKMKNEKLFGKILDINSKGELVFMLNSGKIKYLSSGEISLRNFDGKYI